MPKMVIGDYLLLPTLLVERLLDESTEETKKEKLVETRMLVRQLPLKFFGPSENSQRGFCM